MSDTYSRDGAALVIRFNGETIRIEPWGPDALRVRARPGGQVTEPHVSALLDPPESTPLIEIDGAHAQITNGRLRAEVRLARRLGAEVPKEPEISFVRRDTGQELLSETRSHFAGPSPEISNPSQAGRSSSRRGSGPMRVNS